MLTTCIFFCYIAFMDYDTTSSPLRALLSGGRQQRFPKGQVIQFSQDGMILNVLDTGYVKRYSITNEGTQSVQSVYGPGNIFPLTPVFKAALNQDIYHGNEELYYEAITPVIMHSIDKHTLLKALEDEPMLYRDLFYVSGERLGSNIQRLENMSLRVAYRQVAHQLVHYGRKFGEINEQGITILLPLTHQNLANILNLARETVTTCLNRLQEKGIITIAPHIVILDNEKLKREAY